MSHRPVPPEHVRLLERARAPRGRTAHPRRASPAMRQRLGAALADAAARQDWIPGYPAELELWTRRYAGARDGVPGEQHRAAPRRRRGRRAVAAVPPTDASTNPSRSRGRKPVLDASELLVIGTTGRRHRRPAAGGRGDQRRPAGRHDTRPRLDPAQPGRRSSTPPGARSSATSCTSPNTRSSCCASDGQRPTRRRSHRPRGATSAPYCSPAECPAPHRPGSTGNGRPANDVVTPDDGVDDGLPIRRGAVPRVEEPSSGIRAAEHGSTLAFRRRAARERRGFIAPGHSTPARPRPAPGPRALWLGWVCQLSGSGTEEVVGSACPDRVTGSGL